MKFLHAMLRVKDLDRAIKFFVEDFGLKEIRRKEVPKGKFSLVFLATEKGEAEIELTYNWDTTEEYTGGRNFGHLAFLVDNIYDKCSELQAKGIEILRPPRDGHMAFIKSPDGISIELLQKGESLAPAEPWTDMQNSGTW